MSKKPLTLQERADALFAAWDALLRTPEADRDKRDMLNELDRAQDLVKDLLREFDLQSDAVRLARELMGLPTRLQNALSRCP